jgi:hypothetical protein
MSNILKTLVIENLLRTYGDQLGLDEESKSELRNRLSKEIEDFLSKGGEITKFAPNKVRAKPGMGLASKHIGTPGEIGRKVRSKMLVGKDRNIQGKKPEVAVEQSRYYNSLDQERREQDAMDAEKREFKRRELDWELRNEPKNNYAVHINGRLWKVFADERQAENIARSLQRKGKDAKVYITGASPTAEGKLPPKAGFNKNPHKVGPGTSKDDYEYKKFIPRDAKEKGEEWAIARDVKNVNSRLGSKKPKELDTGFYKSYLGNRPFREGGMAEALDSSAEDFMHRLKQGTLKQNPKGSASEKMLLKRYIMTPMVQDMNLDGREWINQASKWLAGNKEKLAQQYPDLDLSDVNDLAAKMYEDFLAMQGQLEETHSTGTTAGSAGIGGGAGLGIESSPTTKILQAQVDETIQSSQGGMGQTYRKVNTKAPLNEYSVVDNVINVLPSGLDVSEFYAKAYPEYLYNLYYRAEKQNFLSVAKGWYDEYKKKHNMKEYNEKRAPMLIKDIDRIEDLLYTLPKGLDFHKFVDVGLKQYIKHKYGNKHWDEWKNKLRFQYWAAYQKAGKDKPQGMMSKVKSWFKEDQLDELSPETYASYKKKAGAEASAADKAGDFEKGNKRFSGINRATRLQFKQDAKKVKEEQAPMFTPEDEAKMVNANDPGSDGWKVYENKVNVWATMSGRGQGGIPADLRVSEIPIDMLGTRYTGGTYRDTLYFNVLSGNAVRELENEYRKKGKSPDVDKIKDQITKLARAAGLEQDVDGKWFYDVYHPVDDSRKKHITYLKYNFGEPYDKQKDKSKVGTKTESSIMKGLQTEDAYTDMLYKEFLDSEHNTNPNSHIDTLKNIGQFLRSKQIGPDKFKPLFRRLVNKYSPSMNEGDTGVTRWSKENPPPPELLLNTLIQILMNPANTKSPQDLISLWNEKYGLKHTLGNLRQYAQNDYKKAELSKALTKAALAYESFKGK